MLQWRTGQAETYLEVPVGLRLTVTFAQVYEPCLIKI